MSDRAAAVVALSQRTDDRSQQQGLGVVRVEAAPSATVAELCRAAEALSGGGRRNWLGLRCADVCASLDSHLGALPIRSGDTVELVWAAPGGGDGGDEGVAAHGDGHGVDAAAVWWRLGRPSAGAAQHPDMLGCGRYRVGRDPLVNDIVLDHRSVSRTHAAIEVGDDLTVTDLGSSNGTRVDGESLSAPTQVAPGSSLRFGDVELTVASFGGAAPRRGAPRGPAPHAGSPAVFERFVWSAPAPVRFGASVALRRSPKVTRLVEERRIVAPRPPARPAPPRIPWISGLVPVLMGVVMMAVMWAGSGGGAAVWGSGIFFLMSPLLVFGGYAESKRHRRADLIAAQRRFERSFNRAVSEASDALAAEREVLESIAPSVSALVERAATRDSRLWEAANDERFPALRVGTGPTPSAVVVAEANEVAAGELVDDLGDALAARYRRLASEFAVHEAGPRTISLADHTTIALAGPARRRVAVAQSFVAQAMTWLPPSCVEVVVLSLDHGDRDDASREWSALAWLRPDSPARWWANAVVSDPLARRRSIDALVAEPPPPGALRMVVAEDAALSAGELERLVAAASRGGTRLLWCGDRRVDAPAACTVLIEADDAGGVRMTEPRSGLIVEAIAAESLEPGGFERWARSLAPLCEAVPAGPLADQRGDGAELDALLGHDLFGSPESLVQRWARSDGGLGAPIGVEVAGGEPVVIDLAADGPHALVAGTTGAGKSELLRSLIASIAATHPPSRATFLLVDYKGGSAFGELEALPHSVGMITDLDEHLVERVLLSLSAEIRRREHLLRAAGAVDLGDFWRRAPREPLPRLVIVVDEFASITADVPGFLDGMVDIGRRGRSLGLHLVLATQRPAGVVTDHLRANVNLRIALRVADARESVDIVGVADASAITRSTPGRAIVQIGQGEPFAVQSAFVGGRRAETAAGGGRAVTISALGAGATPAPQTCPVGVDTPTDLARLVTRIRSAAAACGVDEPPRPWREPVRHDLGAAAVLSRWRPRSPAPVALLGIADQPERQRQFAATLPLDGTALCAFSADLDAAWALAELAVLSASSTATLEQLRIDVLDGSGRVGRRLAALPHVGSVIHPDDHERIARLLRTLRAGGDAGCGPHRLVIVHHLGALHAAATTRRARAALADLEHVVVDGRSLGVTTLFTADRRRAVPYELFGAIGRRFVMRLADASEYGGLDEAAVRLRSDAVRLGVYQGLAVQVPEVLDTKELERFVAARRSAVRGRRHRPVPMLPVEVSPTDLGSGESAEATAPTTWRWPVGIDDETLRVAWVDLSNGNLLVAGAMRSGKTTVLAALARCARSAPERPLLIGLALDASGADGRSGLPGLAGASDRSDRSSRPPGPFDAVVDVADRGAVDALFAAPPWEAGTPTLLCVDDAGDLDDAVLARLEAVVAASKRLPVRVVLAAEPAAIRTSFGSVLSLVRRERHLLLLSPDPDADDDIAAVPLVHGDRYEPFGRSEYVVRGQSALVALAVADAPEWGIAPITEPGAGFVP